MQLETKKYLLDVQLALDRITRFTDGKDFAAYLADEMLRSAVERQFSVIGEALSRLSKADPAVIAAIRDWQQIVAFRNILIHAYATVDDRIVWGVIENYLAQLRTVIDDLLGSASTP